MRIKLQHIITYMLVGIMAALALAGCSSPVTIELSEEESNLIAEYAAGKLVEYVRGHPGGLMILEDVDRADVNPGMQKEELEEPDNPPMPDSLPAPDMPQDDTGDGSFDEGAGSIQDADGSDAPADVPEDIATVPSVALEDALGTDGAMLTYTYYETASHYPENDTEIAFSMKAAAGKELLILHFDMSNPTDGDIEVVTDSDNFKVRLMLNGSTRLRGDVTFLENDLMNYHGILAAGETVDSVLVFEIPEGEEVSSMDLLIVTDDGEEQYSLMKV